VGGPGNRRMEPATLPTRLPAVVVVGNLTLDDVVLPTGRTRMAAPGGNTVYAALGARMWEPRVGVVTRRGEDFPPEHLARLRKLGIATDGVVDIEGPTVRNWVVYEEDGRRTWIYRTPPGRSEEVAVQPDDIPEDWLMADPLPVVHVAAMPLEAAERIVDRMTSGSSVPLITLDTHEDWGTDVAHRVFALAARVHAFLPSKEELATLTGLEDPEDGLDAIAHLPTPIVVVKMGADGCLVRGPHTDVHVGISPGPVVDVTGAGDAFCGGFAAGLAAGLSSTEAARWGAVSAGFAVADFSSLRLVDVSPGQAAERLASSPPGVHPREGTRPPDRGGDGRRAVSVMREEIEAIPTLIAGQLTGLEPEIADLAGWLTDRRIRSLVLTGCGDSMFAGSAATLAFARLSGIEAEAVHAIDLARYRVRYLRPGTAVVAISYSGEAGRTIEAAAQARRFGHPVVALTGPKEGRLAGEADRMLVLDVPTTGFSPGTSTYVAMAAALMETAVQMGRSRAGAVEARALLATAPEAADVTLARSLGPAREVAERLARHRSVTFIGAGPNEASARFGAAKLFEGPQMLGVATNLEEWAHEDYFVTVAGSPVVMIAPTGASFDRAQEILAELAFVGADVVVVSDREAAGGPAWLPLAPGLPEEFTPLLSALPLSLLAYFMAQVNGKRSYNFASVEAEREHYETIHRDTRGEPA
jgi:sugar/nucleoside kinase (ribokinase family)/fructoselysine-6-P-deglycase FrlB-like protein